MPRNDSELPLALGVASLSCAAAREAPDLEDRFAAFVDTHHDRALRLAWRLVQGDEAAAEDVVQDALLKAFRGLRSFRGESRIDTWFYRILVRQAHSYRRWRRLRERWGASEPEELPDPAPGAVPDPGLRSRIANALAALTRMQREVFLLVHMEGFTVNEAAQILGKAPGTVKTHLKRALHSLRGQLEDVLS